MMKFKKDPQREIESILRTLTMTNKEKPKIESCIKLITIFENSLDVDINFKLLVESIYDLIDYNNPISNKIWIQVINQVIKFRPKYREKLYDKVMDIAFKLKNEDALKLKTLHILTNCCMNLPFFDKRIYEFLIFEGLLNEELHKEILFVMIMHLIKLFPDRIENFMFEFIIETIIIISMKKISFFREKDKTIKMEENEKVLFKSIFQLLEYYMIKYNQKNKMLVYNIIKIYCFYVNYDKDYSWKMMRIFILNDAKLFKVLLELINNDSITFKNVLFETYMYFSIDDFDDENKIIVFNDNYNKFMIKIGDVDMIYGRHKESIIRGTIYFIGMSQWRYERIEKIDTPNIILLTYFLKPVSLGNKKIDTEIIYCLKRLIIKYGEELMDEWCEIFSIIKQIISDNNIFQIENISKAIFDIVDNIKKLIILEKFNGNLDDFIKTIKDFTFSNNDSLYLFKTKYKLYKYYDFLENIEQVFIDIFNSNNDRYKNHILEVIRLNYNNIEMKLKSEKIENIIIKFWKMIVSLSVKDETLVIFANLISIVCVQSSQPTYLEILKIVFSCQSGIYEESEKIKSINLFQKNCLILIYNSLLITSQKQKLENFHKKIFFSFKKANNNDFLLVLIKFLKTLKINKDYELYLSNFNNDSNSEVCINFHCTSIVNHKRNKNLINESLKNESIYSPYLIFKHNKLYEILIQVINKEETNNLLCEEILDLLNYFLKNFYFFKSIQIEKFLNSILLIGDFNKYFDRNRKIEIIIEVLFNISFITNNKNLIDKKNDNYYQLEITEDNMKDRIIQLCLNSLKSFVKIFMNFIEKNSLHENNRITNNFISLSKESISSDTTFSLRNTEFPNDYVKTLIKYINNFISLLSVYFIAIPTINENDKEKNLKNIDFAHTIIDLIYEMRFIFKIKPSLMTSILYFIIKTHEIFITLGQEVVVKIIYLLLSIGWPKYEDDIYKSFSENFKFKLKKFNELYVQRSIIIRMGNADIPIYQPVNLINESKVKYQRREYNYHLTDLACCYYLNKFSLVKVVLKILNSIFKLNHHREKIFVELIKWNLHSKSIRDNLKSEYRAKIFDQSKIYLGKNCIFMIIPLNENLAEVVIRNSISTINITIHNKLDSPENLEQSNYEFLKNLLNDKQKLEKNPYDVQFHFKQVSKQEESNPTLNIQDKKFNSDLSNKNSLKINDQITSISNNPNTRNDLVLNKDTITLKNFIPNLNQLINPNLVFYQFLNIFSDYYTDFKVIEKPFNIADQINILDSTPVYFTYNCGILYIPSKNLNSNSDFEIFSYSEKVSSQYLTFLSKIGGLDRNGNHGRYSIYNHDILFQIIYHVSSLITKENKISTNSCKRSYSILNDEKKDTYFQRKKVIGNNFINIIFFDNSFEDFDVGVIKSQVTFIYILVFPYSNNLYFIKLKANPNSKSKIIEKVYIMFFKEIIINHDNLDKLLKQIIIILNLYISFTLQKSFELKQINDNYHHNDFEFESNISQRYKLIHKIITNYKD